MRKYVAMLAYITAIIILSFIYNFIGFSEYSKTIGYIVATGIFLIGEIYSVNE